MKQGGDRTGVRIKLGSSRFFLRMENSWALVAHVFNPNHLGGRDQKDQGLFEVSPSK
jgi:hypothetical protein